MKTFTFNENWWKWKVKWKLGLSAWKNNCLFCWIVYNYYYFFKFKRYPKKWGRNRKKVTKKKHFEGKNSLVNHVHWRVLHVCCALNALFFELRAFTQHKRFFVSLSVILDNENFMQRPLSVHLTTGFCKNLINKKEIFAERNLCNQCLENVQAIAEITNCILKFLFAKR